MPGIADRTINVGTHETDGNPQSAAPAVPTSGAPIRSQPATSAPTLSRGSVSSHNMVPGFAQSQFAESNSAGYPRSFLVPRIPISPVSQRTALKTTPQSSQQTQAKPGQPFPLLGVSASSEPFKTATGEVKCLVSVSYVSSPQTGARIWFSGYHGSASLQLMTEGPTTPISFLVDATGESVSVYGEAIQGGVISQEPVTIWSPKTTLVLSAATAAPPAPSMAQMLVGTPTGYQFEFNQLAGQAANVIDGYAIYRNTTNSQTSATQISYLKQNPNASSAVLFTDVAAQGQNFYYFIGAVDTSGNESALTSAQTGAIIPLSTFTPTGQLWGASVISGTTGSPLTLGQVHNSVTATTGGATGTGLDNVLDGGTYKKVTGVVAGQTTTQTYAANSISASVVENVVGYTYITSSATVATTGSMPINGGYVTMTACGAVASTNASALGFSLAFYRNGTLLQPQFGYQVFPTPGNYAYIPFSFSILDSSPGAGPNTYTVTMSCNSTGTMTLIPINFIVVNVKA